LHDDGTDASRPWRLDPVPFVLSGSEWAQLESGIAQRAQLLALVLDDLLGEQRLVRSGVVPPAAVAGTPSFIASTLGWAPVGRRLTTYAADLVRAADGSWKVLRDHTDAPAGAGYALLNRDVVGSLMPELSRDARLVSLGPFFAAYRDALAGLAPADSDTPRVVVLSTGVGHPSFFEHSYLATTLGYHLAEVGDVVAAAGHTWLRAIGGLERVDVLLRRVDDGHVDPLEQPDAHSGVPGLLHVARSGGVGMANSVGSGLVGSMTLQPALPDACRTLLGEGLILGQLDALWCGDSERAAKVSADPSDLVLHDVGDAAGFALPSAFGDQLTDAEWECWRAVLRSEPHRVVAQPRIRFGTAPVLGDRGLGPGTVVLRVHAVLGVDGVTVLPGGLARVVEPGRPIVNQAGGVAKDAWILDDGANRPVRLAPPRHAPTSQVDLSGSLPVRTAEAMTWVGRYEERAEALARAARSALGMVQDDPGLLAAAEGAWQGLVARHLLRLTHHPSPTTPMPWSEVFATVATTLAQRIEALALAASSARPFQSSSTWVVLGELTGLAERLRDRAGVWARAGDLDAVIVRLAALSGFAIESTVRGPAWRYLDLGRRLERALVVLDSLDPALGPALPATVRGDAFDHVLRSNESLIAYRRRFRSDAELGPLLDLLVRDHTNPRSIEFQLDALREHLIALGSRDPVGELPALVDAVERAVSLAELFGIGQEQVVERLVLAARAGLDQLNTRLVAVHFADPAVLRPMGSTW
jgi:uncharacterized circularly permuted ATP-grasp superfamily protein/uncharacterized alpha-E superfamily protein